MPASRRTIIAGVTRKRFMVLMARRTTGTLRGELPSAAAMKKPYPKVGPKASTTASTWMKRAMLKPVIPVASGSTAGHDSQPGGSANQAQGRPLTVAAPVQAAEACLGDGGGHAVGLDLQQPRADERAGQAVRVEPAGHLEQQRRRQVRRDGCRQLRQLDTQVRPRGVEEDTVVAGVLEGRVDGRLLVIVGSDGVPAKLCRCDR